MQAMLIVTFTSTNIVVLKVEFKSKHLVKKKGIRYFFKYFFFIFLFFGKSEEFYCTLRVLLQDL